MVLEQFKSSSESEFSQPGEIHAGQRIRKSLKCTFAAYFWSGPLCVFKQQQIPVCYPLVGHLWLSFPDVQRSPKAACPREFNACKKLIPIFIGSQDGLGWDGP